MSAATTVAYLDSSALVKLVIPEAETVALRTELARWQRQVSSALARVEVVRACCRVDPAARSTAEQILDSLDLLSVDDPVLRAASSVAPAALRSLDAVHVASALALGDALGAAFVYDERRGRALAAEGVTILAPA